MKILLVSWYFPPANTIAALRLGKLAKYLYGQGHDVRVIGGIGLPYSQTLSLEIPADRVAYARWADVNAGPRWLTKQVKKFIRRNDRPSTSELEKNNLTNQSPNKVPPSRSQRSLGQLYQTVFNWPDSRIGWMPFALLAGRRLFSRWRPQIILASGPPFTVLLVGYWLSLFYRIPLIIEFRDRWFDDPYYPPPKWRQSLNKFAEGLIARRAVAISTVSEPWANTYRQRYNKPTIVIYNGFDEELLQHSSSQGHPDRDILRIVYTGGIYPGRRDPSTLFEAINQLGDDKRKIRVDFYGTSPHHVWPLAMTNGVVECIFVHDEIDHDRAISEQRQADVLLLMQWDDPKEQGNVPGKFFEYLGALRPILVLGLKDGVPSTLVRKLGAGIYCGNSVAIANMLRLWLEMKQKDGFIPSISENSRHGYSRNEQYEKLPDFIMNVFDGAEIK